MMAERVNAPRTDEQVLGERLRRYDGGDLFVYQDARAFPDVVAFLTA